MAERLRAQLTFGVPTDAAEKTLRQLARQMRAGRVKVKLFLKHPLHAKLYLVHRNDPINPIIGFLGSSNLTLAGLVRQGELNVDVLDSDTAAKLSSWFEDRWNDRWCVDVTEELIQIINESWAREEPIPPYHLYLKMAYHLSQEAREGLTEFKLPTVFGDRLFDFQASAVKIAAHHLNKRGGVLIGDVVGLGKTLMATAVARIFEDDMGLATLIICPPNLRSMWQDYVDEYGLRARVLPLSVVQRELPNLRRFPLVIIDESHNLRNRDGSRYRAIREYLHENESKCILLSATPYNKTYLDLSNQLRLFIEDDQDLGIRPERLLKHMGEVEFSAKHQAGPRTLAAFDLSEFADDWRDLMRLYLVRRTRSFIQEHYADQDPTDGRRYLTFEDGSRSYFPARTPKTLTFAVNDADPTDQYAQLYSDEVVKVVTDLRLPRYGLGNHMLANPGTAPSAEEQSQIDGLARAGQRLIGFCRTNLFKRLESGGSAFLQSVHRHVLRNYVFLHAIRNGSELPLGSQDAEMLDSRFTDADEDETIQEEAFTRDLFEQRAAEVYDEYRSRYRSRFNWLRASLFASSLERDLVADCEALLGVLSKHGDWNPEFDTKLTALHTLLTENYPSEKVLIFSQYADTVDYLVEQLKRLGIEEVAGVTGSSPNPTEYARRFSPNSNPRAGKDKPEQAIRVLIATDVLSEGQNLQDCHIVVNYDLPWAIIRLIQRAGRVDRIGQDSSEIFCHSFLPAEGVNRIIRLRDRVRDRLRENSEVVGADDVFFEDDDSRDTIRHLYNEQAGILDGDADGEVDLSSRAFQIWQNAVTADPSLERIIKNLPDMTYSSRAITPSSQRPEGVLVFARTADGNDALSYIDKNGGSVSESQFEILAAAECHPDTAAQERHERHHELVESGVQHIITEAHRLGGQLGRPSGARYRAYTRLKAYQEEIRGQIFDSQTLRDAIDAIYRFPLRQTAVDGLNRQLRSGISDDQLAELVTALHEDDRLVIGDDLQAQTDDPRIICSIGLFASENGS